MRSDELLISGTQLALYFKFIPPYDGEVVIAADIHSSAGGTGFCYAYSPDSSTSINTQTNLDWRTALNSTFNTPTGLDSITLFSSASSTYVNKEAVLVVKRAQPVYILISRNTTNVYIQNLEIYWDIVEVN
jgi:hypothetical protein